MTILFYDWPKIKRHSNKKVQTIRTIFESMMDYNRPAVGRSRYDKIDFSGDSFLLNPERLLKAFQTTNQVDCANYLMLAAYRYYPDYLLTGDLTLPTRFVNIPITTLRKNSLIEIIGTEIHFLLES